MNMKISVIIPVRNRAHLLPLTLDNLLAQSHKPYEIIVVDDHSTDNLPEVVGKYGKQVIFTSTKGQKVSGARNTGFRIATGNAIQFFDSDDLMTLNKLQVQSETMQRHGADLVYGPFVKAILVDGVWKQADVVMQYHPLPPGNLADFVLKGWCNITQSAMFSRDFLKEVGPWNETLMPHEDFEFWFRVGKNAKKFVHENCSCVIYRQHHQQITDLDVSVRSRWKDGILAMKYIKDGIDFEPSPASRALFNGRYAASKARYKTQYGKEENIDINLLEYLTIPYYRLKNKIGRISTGTQWQKMHGPEAKPEIFDKYIKML
jgi:glycosyltransferase involved in cell wall biosynthesis